MEHEQTLRLFDQLIAMAGGWIIPLAMQRWLRSRMTQEQLSRTWPWELSALGLLYLGHLTLLPFVWVTRPRQGWLPGAKALGVGVALTALSISAVTLASWGYATAVGLPDDDAPVTRAR